MCDTMGNLFNICISGFIDIHEWKLKSTFTKKLAVEHKKV